MDFEATYFSGGALYGDDFSEEEIRRWFAEEERGYFDLTQTYCRYQYSYHALNEFHAYRYLPGPFDVCLALGCARGDDVEPLSGRVGRFIAVEPAEQWWHSSIGGTPATYLKPTVRGDLPLDAASVDLAVCLDVLHHIPNAGHVLSEMARVLRPGGMLVLREPINTMGDWRRPRPGLTANERGLPLPWLEQRVAANQLTVVRKAFSNFPLTPRLARWLRCEPGFNHDSLVRLDALLSRMMRWNLHYHRDSFLKKIAPLAVSFLLRRQ